MQYLFDILNYVLFCSSFVLSDPFCLSLAGRVCFPFSENSFLICCCAKIAMAMFDTENMSALFMILPFCVFRAHHNLKSTSF